EEGGITCINVIEAKSASGSCGRSADIQRNGDIEISSGFERPVRVGALMPNGVGSVTLIDRDGSTRNVKVANNVAEAYDSNIASVQFQLPNGSLRTERIPSGVLNPTP